jgi:hypothetical protein
MRPFEYIRATDPAQAVATVAVDPAADYLAGGTTQVDLMLKDGIVSPERLVDVTRLPLKWITADATAIRVGATTTMEELAADPTVSERLPFVRDALLDSASVQLRNMATIGGNLLQRTRCRYFRDPAVEACNKRRPGTGCAAVTEVARMHAILGASPDCIALHASDLAVTLIALDTIVHILGPPRILAAAPTPRCGGSRHRRCRTAGSCTTASTSAWRWPRRRSRRPPRLASSRPTTRRPSRCLTSTTHGRRCGPTRGGWMRTAATWRPGWRPPT